MEKFVKFCTENWQFLVAVGIAIINLLILIFKKKVKANDIVGSLLSVMPTFINDAESLGLSGNDKLQKVIMNSLEYLQKLTGDDLPTLANTYGLIIQNSVESILSTPQKKED